MVKSKMWSFKSFLVFKFLLCFFLNIWFSTAPCGFACLTFLGAWSFTFGVRIRVVWSLDNSMKSWII